jgi:hypothetical protein
MRLSLGTRAMRPALAFGITLLLLLGSLSVGAFGARPVASPRASPLLGAHPDLGSRELAMAEQSLAISQRSDPRPATLPPVFSPGGFTWTNLTGRLTLSPSARVGSAAGWDPADGYVLLYGGQDAAGSDIGDTWSFSNGTWTNLTGSVRGSPPDLAIPSLSYDPSGHDMVLFGGVRGIAGGENQTWTYRDLVWTNLTGHTGATPPIRIFNTMTTDTAAGEVILFGGEVTSWFTDTWSFKSGTWTNLTPTAGFPAGAIAYPCAGDDPAAGGVVLYGLYSPAASTLDYATLLFTGGNWRNLTALTSGQSANMLLGSAAYLASISSVAFVSGATYNSTGGVQITTRTAEYSNETWTNVTSVLGGPPGIGELAAVSDLAGGQAILGFGGSTAVYALDSTWVLSAPLFAKVGATHIVEEVGASDSFSSTVSGGYGPVNYHWSFGDGLTASSAAPSHSFTRAGLFEVNLSTSDVVGHFANASIWVEVEPALAAAASADPTPATAGSPVALAGSWTGGVPPYTFAWSLGDLNSSTVSALAHTYAKAGNYSVGFTVTDALGDSAAASLALSVRAAPSTSSPASSSVSLTSGTGLFLLLGILLLAVVAAVLGALLARRPRSPPGPPQPYAAAPSSGPAGNPPPPGAGGPPAG